MILNELETVQSYVINVRSGAWDVVWKKQGKHDLIPRRCYIFFQWIWNYFQGRRDAEILNRTELIFMSSIRMGRETQAHH
jgi:hypothetical protein